MAQKTCFVVMAIGEQVSQGKTISRSQLKQRYEDLIKEAILKADPTLDVIRSDEISMPGSITTDILTRLMHSDYVVADISYPNPNVFYELGLRHACHPGTAIIKEKDSPSTPFDIAHLRYVEYENTPTGLKELSLKLKGAFEHLRKDPTRPDNHFLELAKVTGYRFPEYGERMQSEDLQMEVFMNAFASPEIRDLIIRQASGEKIDETEMLRAIMANPKVGGTLIKALVQSGDLSFSGTPKRAARRQVGKKVSKRRKKKK